MTTPTTIFLSEAAWIAFVTALQAPPQPNEELKKLLSTPSPWEDEG